MYETRHEALAPKKLFYQRLAYNFIVGMLILAACLLIGVVGYHFLGPMAWIDALHNASMILSGMGPVATVETYWGKIFSSAYALFSGVAFITNIGFILAPAVHRFLHRLHVQEK